MAASFVADHRNELTAVITVVAAIVLAKIVDRALIQRARKLSEAVSGRSLSAVADTRLRLVRRLVFATIIVIGIALAMSQFPSVKRVATGILASSAVLGLVVGFAARQTLANGIAGMLLAITQPIRIGDLVTLDGETGEVEDVRLTYTYIRCDDGRRLIVPNELLASGTIENHTVVDPRVQVEVSVWIAPRRRRRPRARPSLRLRGRERPRRRSRQGRHPPRRDHVGRLAGEPRKSGRGSAARVLAAPPRGFPILIRSGWCVRSTSHPTLR